MSTDTLSVLITGGASGIGEATARRVVAGGGHVGIADRDEVRAAALATELGSRAHWVACDASSEESVGSAHATLSSRMPPFNGLVASAAITPKARSAAKVTADAFWTVVDSHLRWTYVANRLVGLEMAKRGRGSIVNIASVLAYRPGPVTGYSEGKAAVVNLTQALAVEWALNGVRVNAVAPGWTDTPFLDARRAKGSFKEITDAVPQARMIAPAEIAEVIYFLLSPVSSAITGATIPCDAGYIAGTGWAPHGGLAKAD
ncbi:MAG: SDR family oxidoreductase [Hyphomicrobiaceae bacterium]|nr:SDR family oxidoreductase [Hyphomicrobiaceae bacterium]